MGNSEKGEKDAIKKGKSRKPKNKLIMIGEFTNTLGSVPDRVKRVGYETYLKVNYVLDHTRYFKMENLKIEWQRLGSPGGTGHTYLATIKVNFRMESIHQARKHARIIINWQSWTPHHWYQDFGAEFDCEHALYLINEAYPEDHASRQTIVRSLRFTRSFSEHTDWVANAVAESILKQIKADIVEPINTQIQSVYSHLRTEIEKVHVDDTQYLK